MAIRIGIRGRLAIAFGLVVTVPIVALGLSYSGMIDLGQQSKNSAEMSKDALLASEMNADMAKVLINTRQYISTRNSQDLDETHEFLQQMRSGTAIAQKDINQPERAQLVDQIEDQLGEFELGLSQIVELYSERDRIVADVINTIGPDVRKDLTTIRETAALDGDYASANDAAAVQEDFLLSRLYTTRFLLSNDKALAERAGIELTLVGETLETLQGNLENPQRLALVAKIRPQIVEFANAVQRIDALIEERNHVRDTQLYAVGATINDAAAEIKESAVADAAVLRAVMLETAIDTENLTMLLSIGAFFTAILIICVAGQALAGPVVRLSNTVNAIGSGELDTAVPGLNRSDELGQMAHAIEVLRDAAKERRTMAAELADRFEHEIGEMLQSVASASTELGATTETMMTVASDNAQQSVHVAAMSTQSTANIQTIAASTEEMSASIQEINEQLRRAETITTRASEQSHKAVDRMESLNDQAAKISEVVELITQIAEQTNLLALNATIESARAGDAGRGFAVVAQEVKSLAGQTANSSGEIREQISRLLEAAGETGDEIKEVRNVMSELNEIAAGIAAAMEEQAATTQEISRSTNEAVNGNNEVNQSIQSIETSAGSTRDATQQITETSEELSQNASGLHTKFQTVLASLRAA